MKIIVGIGNPGKQYTRTRHNIGFMVLDRLAEERRFGPWRRRFHALCVEGRVADEKVLLMKPDTYVNESGRAVRAAVDWCRVAPQDIMVVCDDFNLSLGRLRVRGGGSSGGHNGLKSIADCVATEDVPRLRIGIGSERESSDRDFVLAPFLPDECDAAEQVVARSARALETWLEHGLERCQNEYNATPKSRAEEDDA